MGFLQSLLTKFLKRASAEGVVQPEMSFLDHLEELRWDVIKALIGILIATIICAIYTDFICTEHSSATRAHDRA